MSRPMIDVIPRSVKSITEVTKVRAVTKSP